MSWKLTTSRFLRCSFQSIYHSFFILADVHFCELRGTEGGHSFQVCILPPGHTRHIFYSDPTHRKPLREFWLFVKLHLTQAGTKLEALSSNRFIDGIKILLHQNVWLFKTHLTPSYRLFSIQDVAPVYVALGHQFTFERNSSITSLYDSKRCSLCHVSPHI